MPFILSRFIENECLVISTALKCDQPPRLLLPGYMEGSKPVIRLYFPWGHLLWHNTSAFIHEELILSDMICDSGCWDRHWDIVSVTSPCSFVSTTLMSKTRQFCRRIRAYLPFPLPIFCSTRFWRLRLFPIHKKFKVFLHKTFLFWDLLCFPHLHLTSVAPNRFLYFTASCLSVSFFLFFSFHFSVTNKCQSRIRALVC